tara:strand:+ start:134 stop:538 length:405 start_codon:yes stop_codon:yes gene_type:complete
LVSVDRNEITAALPGAVRLRGDVFELQFDDLAEHSSGRVPPFDLILSDMAPSTTGVPLADHVASVELCQRALELARKFLRPGGGLVVKVFQGEDEPLLRKELKVCFQALKSMKPKATRSQSVETFLVATGFRGS